MRIMIINQTFYPDVAATAQIAFDLAEFLTEHGHQMQVVTSRSLYGKTGAVLPRRETVKGIEIYRVGMSIFGKKSILLRVMDFGFFYLLAALRALTLRKADVVVTLTTPPFIAFLGWIIKTLRRSKFVYWVMDLYPDLPIACGVMKEKGVVAGFFERLNRFSLRRADGVVTLGRCMRERVLDKGVNGERVVTIPIWSVQERESRVHTGENKYRKDWGLEGKFVAMYSGNLGIGHDAETFYRAAEKLQGNERIRFLFVGGGKRSEELKRYVESHQLKNVIIQPYQPLERLAELLAVGDVHLVSLLERVTGIMVPSKMWGIMEAGRPAIFVGSEKSEIARIIRENDCGFVLANGDAEGLAALLTRLSTDPAAGELGPRAYAGSSRLPDREVACAAWERLLSETVQRRTDSCANPVNREIRT